MRVSSEGFSFADNWNALSVTALPDGGMLRVIGGNGLLVQRYSAEGELTNSYTLVTTSTPLASAKIEALPDGRSVAVWIETTSGYPDNYGDIKYQYLDAAGLPIAQPVVLQKNTSKLRSVDDLVATANGGFLIEYSHGDYTFGQVQVVNPDGSASFPGLYTSGAQLFALPNGQIHVWAAGQRTAYDATGKFLSTATTAIPFSEGWNTPQFIRLTDGSFVAATTVSPYGQKSYQQFHRFDANGVSVGGVVTVPDSAGSMVELITLDNARFAIISAVKATDREYESRSLMQLQLFEADGSSATPIVFTGPSLFFGATVLADGRIAVNWYDNSIDSKIRMSLFDVGAGPDLSFTMEHEILAGTAGNDVFVASPGTLSNGDEVFAGSGHDVVLLDSSGTLDASQVKFSAVEELRGSAGNDRIAVSAETISAVPLIDGREGTDILQATTSLDLRGHQFLNIESIEASGDDTITITVADAAQAMLVHSGSSFTVVKTPDFELSALERRQLFVQGVDEILSQNGIVYEADGGGKTLQSAQQISTETSNILSPQMTSLANGGYVMTWQASSPAGAGVDIFQQRYNADGVPQGSESLVNTYVTRSQSDPAVASLADVGYVIVWESVGQTGHGGSSYKDIYFQRFSAEGLAQGSETRANTTTLADQEDPSIAVLTNGNFVVSWTDNDRFVRQQIFSPEGVAIGGEMTVAAADQINHSSLGGSQVTALAGGDYLVTWQPGFGYNGTEHGYGIIQQRFDSTGARVGEPIAVVASDDAVQSDVRVTGLADGGYVVTWQAGDIVQQVFDRDGMALDVPTQIISYALYAYADDPVVAALSDGGYVVGWKAVDYNNPDGQFHQIFYTQRFDAQGHKTGDVLAMGDASSGATALTALADGGYSAAFSSWTHGRRPDGGSYPIEESFWVSSYKGVDLPNNRPVVEHEIASQTTHSGDAFSFTFNSDVFSDPDGDSLTYYGLLPNTDPLPAWLSFDSATRTFSGTPGKDDAGDIVIRVFALDDERLHATTDFTISVEAGNRAPIVVGALPVIPAAEDRIFSFTMPSGLFVDPDAGDRLTYTASMADGRALPKWLSFFSANQRFTGAPDDGDIGSLTLRITATDSFGETAHVDFELVVLPGNDPPIITSKGGPAGSVIVSENTTAVMTAVAADPDAGDRISWSISGGTDASLFTIDAATGALAFKTAPDFETAKDGGKDNIYDITIKAMDAGGLSATQALRVIVTNINEAPAITSSASVSIAENKTTVTTVKAGDPEKGTLAWSISGGADKALFQIDAKTGALSFKSAPDFEAAKDGGKDNIYDITIKATDAGGLADTQAIKVTVTNVNEAPTITSSASVGIAENKTAVTTVKAADPEKGTLAWSISGGADKALFRIDAKTGALSFKSAPDFEAAKDGGKDNLYDVTVKATDACGLVATQALKITVTNVNEAPAITSSASVSITENKTAATTVKTTDPEKGALSYTLSGTDASLFKIDQKTGVISFKAAPDFEAAKDSGKNNLYDVTVKATDAGGLAVTQALKITVTNVNEAPVITSSASVRIAENKTAVATVKAVDPEKGTLAWSISGGADKALFQIDAKTGVLSFKSAPDFEAAKDNGKDNIYEVAVKATDGGKLADTQTIKVTVTDVKGASLKGTTKADSLLGTSEDDVLIGAGGNDILVGGSGKDKLTGGAGADTLTGGADSDIFIFTSIKDSTFVAGGRDTITDFSQKQKDIIDLKAIDATSATTKEDAFAFIATSKFSKKAGELRYEQKSGDTFIHGDVDGDGKADFSVLIEANINLMKTDFIL